MLAGKRRFVISETIYETPMVVPSFSSRGFPEIKKIIAGASEYANDLILISAYDYFHGLILKKGWTFPDLIFLDSGGYEKGAATDLSDHRRACNKCVKDWKPKLHRQMLKQWDFPRPTVIISYDNPDRRISFEAQVQRAKKLFEDYPNGGKEILLKATSKANDNDPTRGYVTAELFESVVDDLNDFDIIGVTEKELGRTLTGRLATIYKIRTILDANQIPKPIHVFGSLDPVSTPLYFLAGADIFDGLTWLRFGYNEELAIYRHNHAALRLNHDMLERTVNRTIHQQNHNSLVELGIRMRRFLNNKDFDVFGTHSELFQKCMDELAASLGGK